MRRMTTKALAIALTCALLGGMAAAQRGGSDSGRGKPSPSSFVTTTSAPAPYTPPATSSQARPATTPHPVAPLAVRAPQTNQPNLQQMQTQAAIQHATVAAKPAVTPSAQVVTPAPVAPPVAAAAPLPAADTMSVFAVDYRGGLLSVVAEKAELGKLINMVGSKTGASVEVAPEVAAEPVVARLGPGSPRQVLSQLLDSPHLAYIVMGSDEDGSLQRIVIRRRNSFGRENFAAMRAPAPAAAPVAAPAAEEVADPAQEASQLVREKLQAAAEATPQQQEPANPQPPQ